MSPSKGRPKCRHKKLNKSEREHYKYMNNATKKPGNPPQKINKVEGVKHLTETNMIKKTTGNPRNKQEPQGTTRGHI